MNDEQEIEYVMKEIKANKWQVNEIAQDLITHRLRDEADEIITRLDRIKKIEPSVDFNSFTIAEWYEMNEYWLEAYDRISNIEDINKIVIVLDSIEILMMRHYVSKKSDDIVRKDETLEGIENRIDKILETLELILISHRMGEEYEE